MKFSGILAAALLGAITMLSYAFAHEKVHGNLLISHPHIAATIKAAPVAAGYLMIENKGTEDDRLLSVSAGFSEKQQIHTMTMVEGIMRMRPLKDGIIIPAGQTIQLNKGADHLMFMKLSEQMQAGEKRKVTLVFEKAGAVSIEMMVVDQHYMDKMNSGKSGHTMKHGEMNHGKMKMGDHDATMKKAVKSDDL